MRYTTPEANPVLFPYGPARGLAGSLRYEAILPGPIPRTLDAALTEKRCVDTMSGEVFPWTADLRLDGRLLHGCAREGESVPDVR